MKTDDIYIAQLAYLLKSNYKGTLRDYLMGPGVYQHIKYQPIKYIVVKKVYWNQARDLKTKKKYFCEIPINIGELYLVPSSMIPFDLFYPDMPRNLSKRKILKLGNTAINEIIKKENEEK